MPRAYETTAIGTLEMGRKYPPCAEDFVGWTAGDGTDTTGYCLEHYFDNGVYLGPDVHGIEPLFRLIDLFA